jgi:RecT family
VSLAAWGEPSVSVMRRKLLDAAVRAQIAPDATDAELIVFAQVCANFGLSPFADQIVLVGRYNRRLSRLVHRHQITVAGRRALAARTGQLVGIEGPVWCGPRVRGLLEWREVWDDENDQPPYCARVLVHRKGWVAPANGTAKWSEFVQKIDGKIVQMWQQMPSHMLGKCAESLALRRAFPDVITPDVLGAFSGDDDAEDLAELHEAGSVVDLDPPERPDPDEVQRLQDRVAALPPAFRDAFYDWKNAQQFYWPWPPSALADMGDKLDEIEGELEAPFVEQALSDPPLPVPDPAGPADVEPELF